MSLSTFSRRLSSRLTLVLLRWLALEEVVAVVGAAGDVDADVAVAVVSADAFERVEKECANTNSVSRQC